MTKVSVVVPVFGCHSTLGALAERVGLVFEKSDHVVELILVDDGNSDQTWDAIESLAGKYGFVKGLRLSRNFGQHAAIMAGLRATTGDSAVVMDCDLQDPPELIPNLLELLADFQVVIGVRTGIFASRTRRIQATFYSWLLRVLTGSKIDPRAGSFSAISRSVIDEYVKFNERDHHYLLILNWLGFPTTHLEYDREDRSQGDSSYRLFDRIRHACRGFFFESARFLYFVAAIGLFSFLSGLLLSLFVAVRALLVKPPSGWVSLMLSTLTMSGLIVAMIAVIGLYVARSFEQIKSRPLYIIETTTP